MKFLANFKLKGIKLYEIVDRQFYWGVLITKGTDQKSLKIPLGEDYTENYYDDKFYCYFDSFQDDIEEKMYQIS